MKEIDVKRSAAGQTVTALSYGASRSGKTRFAATWPRPVFLAEDSEKGWETIRYMPPDEYFEPDRPPTVWALEDAGDMFTCVDRIKRELRDDRNKYRTIVIDSLTFYLDSYFRYLEAAAMSKSVGKRPEGRLLYSDLNMHFGNLAIELSKLPVNIVWICLERAPSEDNPAGAPMIPGQLAEKTPARCNYLFYHRTFVDQMKIQQYEIRTKRFGAYNAGGRDGGILPDPLPSSSYRALVEALDLPTTATPLPQQAIASGVVRRVPGKV